MLRLHSQDSKVYLLRLHSQDSKVYLLRITKRQIYLLLVEEVSQDGFSRYRDMHRSGS